MAMTTSFLELRLEPRRYFLDAASNSKQLRPSTMALAPEMAGLPCKKTFPLHSLPNTSYLINSKYDNGCGWLLRYHARH